MDGSIHAPAQPDNQPDNRVENRDKWGSKMDFILSCLGYAVGLGNVWRFPYLCAGGGGASFLIPYLIMMVFAGFPVFYMELAIGQYCGLSPHILYKKMCPIFGGIGYTMVVISFCVMVYYNMVLGWSLFYLGQSMQKNVPWATCKNPWNSDYCTVKREDNSSSDAPRVSAADEFYSHALGDSNNVDVSNIGFPQWKLVVSLFGAWVLVFFCLLKGVKSSGKVVYFTATFPYILLLVLLIRGATLTNAWKGIEFFIKPNVTKLLEAKTWGSAATQIFFSLSLGGGGLTTLASYNKFKNNILRDTLIVVLGNCMTSLFAGFVIFSVVGHVAYLKQVEVVDLQEISGAGMAFQIYPVALANLSPVQLWSILFFFMLILLGIDSQMVIVEVVITCILDQWPKLRKGVYKVAVLGSICFVSFIIGIVLTTPQGPKILDLIDTFVGGWTLVIACLVEVCMVSYAYGLKRFLKDIKLMLGKPPSKLWKYLGYPVNYYWTGNWVLITPVLLAFVLIFSWIDQAPISCPWKGNTKVPCPAWFQLVGWLLTTLVVIFIPLSAAVTVVQAFAQKRKWKWLITPSKTWAPNDYQTRKKLEEQQQRVAYALETYDNSAYFTPTAPVQTYSDDRQLPQKPETAESVNRASWEDIPLENTRL